MLSTESHGLSKLIEELKAKRNVKIDRNRMLEITPSPFLELFSDSESSYCSLDSGSVGSKRKKCSLSTLVGNATEPQLQFSVKRKRRKRATTKEERERRAIERKQKNRESAQRSRQRVLNELQKNNEEINVLRTENQLQKKEIARLKQMLQEAELKLDSTKLKPSMPIPSFDELKFEDVFDCIPQMSFDKVTDDYSEIASFERFFIFSKQLEIHQMILFYSKWYDIVCKHITVSVSLFFILLSLRTTHFHD